jgi:hypothetical protein
MPEIIKTIISARHGIAECHLERLPANEPLYAVYCTYQEREYCFHIAFDPPGVDFKVVDKHNCPYDLHDVEFLLSAAIEHHHA